MRALALLLGWLGAIALASAAAPPATAEDGFLRALVGRFDMSGTAMRRDVRYEARNELVLQGARSCACT